MKKSYTSNQALAEKIVEKIHGKEKVVVDGQVLVCLLTGDYLSHLDPKKDVVSQLMGTRDNIALRELNAAIIGNETSHVIVGRKE